MNAWSKPRLAAVRKPNPFTHPHIPTYREQLARLDAQEGTMLMPIKRNNVRNALITALAREGVNVTVDVMDNALTWLSEGDPRPEHLPASFVFCGVRLEWPRGRETRVPTADERSAYNRALALNNNELLDGEDNVRVYREVYETLLNRVTNAPELLPVLQPLGPLEVVSEPVRTDGVPHTVSKRKASRSILTESGTNTVPTVEHLAPVEVYVNTLSADVVAQLDDLTAQLEAMRG